MSPTKVQRLAHAVFFTLKDPDAGDDLVAACEKYLTGHEGEVHFSVGRRGEAYQRPVNDQAFHVALLLVFASEADHDRYQTSERHQQFLAEQSMNWAQVRVFDALA